MTSPVQDMARVEYWVLATCIQLPCFSISELFSIA